jgi:hypothetical protein
VVTAFVAPALDASDASAVRFAAPIPHVTSPDLRAARAGAQHGCESLAVGDPAGGDQRQRYRMDDEPEQRQETRPRRSLSHGPVDVAVEVLRAGRLVAICDVRMSVVAGDLRLAHLAGSSYHAAANGLPSKHRPGSPRPRLARFQTRNVREGHLEERGELWSRDGQLLAESQQLALLGPVGPS